MYSKASLRPWARAMILRCGKRAHAAHQAQRGVRVVERDDQKPRHGDAGLLQHFQARRVSVVGLGAEAAHQLDLVRVVVDERGADAQAVEHARHHLTETAEAGDDDRVRFLDCVGRALGAHRQARREHTLVQQHEERRGEHGGGDRGVEHVERGTREDLVGGGEQHEGEFADLRQAEGEEERIGAAAVAEGPGDRVEQRRLQRHHCQRQPQHEHGRAHEQAEVHRHADGDEEQPEQQPLEGLDVDFQFMAVFRVGEHHAGEERTQRHRHADRLHQRAHAEYEKQREGDEDIALTRAGDNAQQWAQQKVAGDDQHGDQRKAAPQRHPVQAAARLLRREQPEQQDERNDGEVLKQQHREARLAARRGEQALLLQRGERDRGRGHGESHASDQRHLEGQAERPAERRHGGEGGGHLHRAHAEDRAAHLPQLPRLEIQSDEEEQQHDAKFREAADRLGVRHELRSPRADGHAGGEKAEHRAQTEAREQRHCDHAGGEVDERLVQETVIGHAGLPGRTLEGSVQ
jgi:hypothetical protein